MSADSSSSQSSLLRSALDAFLTHGFHAVTTAELQSATGCDWPQLCSAYGDKEGLFLASVEAALNGGTLDALALTPEMLRMIEILEGVRGNSRLKIIHRQPLDRLKALAEVQGVRPQNRDP